MQWSHGICAQFTDFTLINKLNLEENKVSELFLDLLKFTQAKFVVGLNSNTRARYQ